MQIKITDEKMADEEMASEKIADEKMADEKMADEEMAGEKIADENLPLIFAESIKVEENSELQEEDPFEEVSNYQENSENLQEFESHSMLRADYYKIVGPIVKKTRS